MGNPTYSALAAALDAVGELGTAAVLDVPATGNASVTQVVKGNDTRLSTSLSQGTRTSTTVPVGSSTGSSATLTAADESNAGIMTASDKVKLDGLSSLSSSSIAAISDGQTAFTISYPTSGVVFWFLNSGLLLPSEITAVNGTSATLTSGIGVLLGDTLRAYYGGTSLSGTETIIASSVSSIEFSADITSLSSLTIQSVGGGITFSSGSETVLEFQFYCAGSWVTSGYAYTVCSSEYGSVVGSSGTISGCALGSSYSGAVPASFNCSSEFDSSYAFYRTQCRTSGAGLVNADRTFSGYVTLTGHPTKCRLSVSSGTFSGKVKLNT